MPMADLSSGAMAPGTGRPPIVPQLTSPQQMPAMPLAAQFLPNQGAPPLPAVPLPEPKEFAALSSTTTSITLRWE
eukprot:3682708-Rhodomonas_salina.2